MQLQKENVFQTLFNAIDEVNEMLAEEERLKKLPDTLLTGDGGKLTSLGLINFIVEVEGRVKKNFGLDLNLIEALEAPDDPMKNIGRLADFISKQDKGEGV